MKVRKIGCNSLLATGIFWKLGIFREGFTEFFRWTSVLLKIHIYYNLRIKIWEASKQWIMCYWKLKKSWHLPTFTKTLFWTKFIRFIYNTTHNMRDIPPTPRQAPQNNTPSTWLNWDGKWGCRYSRTITYKDFRKSWLQYIWTKL